MEWRDTAYHWLSQSASFITSTAWKTWDAIKATPDVALHFMANPTTRQISNSILHIIIEDLIPFLYLNHALTSFQQYIGDTKKESPDAWPSYFMLQTIHCTFRASFFLYSLRQRQRLVARTSVLTLENSHEWSSSKLRKTGRFTICEEKKCSDMRFIHGSIRDLGIFYLTEMGIFLLNYTSFVGSISSAGLSIYHKGRYALAAVTPEMCQRHRLDYIDENKALALSLGILHKISTFSLSQLISLISNIPADEIEKMIDLLLMLPTTATAARLDLPPSRKHAPTQWKDPLAYYERFMGWWVDVILYGLKKQVPKLLSRSKTVLDWNAIQKRYDHLSKHSAGKLAAYILISSTFHSTSRLRQDPVIKHFWSRLCETMADIAEGAVSWGNSWTLRTLTLNEMTREVSIQFAHWYKRYPESLVKLTINLIINKAIQTWLLQFAKTLRDESKTLPVLSENFFLRQAKTLGHLLERSFQINHDDTYDAAMIMVNTMLRSAKPICGMIKIKPKEIPSYPFNRSEGSFGQPASLTTQNERPTSLEFASVKTHKPSKLSIFSTHTGNYSPSQGRGALRFPANFQ